MIILALILGILGAGCAAIGFFTALQLLDVVFVPTSFTPMLWMATSVVLLLMTIACVIASTRPPSE